MASNYPPGMPLPGSTQFVIKPGLPLPGSNKFAIGQSAPQGPKLGPPVPPGFKASQMSPQQVRSMQQFLINHGYQLAADGILGPLTKSAAASFRQSHLSAPSWNAEHGLGVHPGDLSTEAAKAKAAIDAPSKTANVSAAPPRTLAGSTGPSGPPDPTSALIAALFAQGGKVGQMVDPNYYATAAAAPANATAQAVAQQVALDPKQEAQNQYDISSWYGLNPKDPNYGISVLGRLAQARAADAGVASDASSNVSQIASALAGSIGGAANGGSGSLAANGSNDATMMAALGKASTDYADAMNPLLAAEARGQMLKEKAANSQALLALQQQLAAARGQATSDAATARANAIGANNSLAQQQFADKGNLLSLMAQMGASGLKTEYTQAQIARLLAEANHYNQTPAGKNPKVDPVKALNSIGTIMNLPSGTNKVPANQVQWLAKTIGTVLRLQFGLHPGDGLFKRMGDQLLLQFTDESGNPIQPGPGWLV